MEKERSTAAKVSDFIYESFRLVGRYFLSRPIISLILGVICFFVLWIIGVKLKLLISIIVAVMTLIPYIGPIIAIIVSAVIAVFQAPVFALWVTLVNLGLQILDAALFSPLLMSKSLGLHPVIIVVAILIGGSVFGFFGLLFAIPAAAITGLIIKKIWNKKRDADAANKNHNNQKL